MPDYVCSVCGHRKMEADSSKSEPKGPQAIPADKKRLMVMVTMISCWSRMNEIELRINERQSGKLHLPLSDEDRADYEKLRRWWNDLGATKRNGIKNAAAEFSKNMVEMTMVWG